MNLFLHNIGDINSEPPIVRNDSLIFEPSENIFYSGESFYEIKSLRQWRGQTPRMPHFCESAEL